MRSEVEVSVFATSDQNIDHQLNRGEIVQTGDDEYLILNIGGLAHIGLAERTDIELDRLFDDELEITITRGRIVVELLDPDTTIRINTNETETQLLEGRISLINFDFLETINISPWDTASGTVTTNVSKYPLYEPLSIHETSAVTTATDFEPEDPFYDWYVIR